MARLVLLLAALLLLAGTAMAASKDDKVFDSLFGTEPERVVAGPKAQAGRDDLSIVELVIGTHTLSDSMLAFAGENGPCLPVDTTLDALEIEHRVEGDVIIIQLHAPERQIRIDPAVLGAALRPSPEGQCLDLDAWGHVLPITARDDSANLRIVLETAEPLPVVARLDRIERRRDQLQAAEPARPDYPRIANPDVLVSAPTVDVAIGAGIGSSGAQGLLGIEGSASVLNMTSRFRATLATQDDSSLFLTLSRDSPEANLLGPLRARHFAIGDINVPAQPLIGVAAGGRGIIVSNQAQWQADLFDTIDLRGPLPRGWEAELHRDDRLIGFVGTPNAQGDYLFAAVPLRAGANTYTVRLYGPHGEVEERRFTRFIGAELNPENEFVYAIGVVDTGKPLIGPPLSLANAAGPVAFGTVSRGLTGSVSMRVDVRAPLDGTRPTVAAGLHAAVLGGFGSVIVAGDGSGRPAIAVRGARQLGPANILFEAADYGTLAGDQLPSEIADQARSIGVSAETRLPLGRFSMPVTLGWQRDVGRLGSTVDLVQLNSALAIGPLRISQNSSYERRSQNGETNDVWFGNIGLARALGAWRLRGGLDWRVDRQAQLQQIGVTAARATPRGSFGVALGWDAQRGQPTAAVSAERRVGPVSLIGNAGIDAGGWQIGFGISAALYRDPQKGYALAEHGMGRSGSVLPHVFADRDGDGLQGTDEPDIAGAKFLVDSSMRREVTGADGRSRIGGLTPGRPLDMELQLASLPDLNLRPAQPGVSVTVRAGQALEVAVPLRPTGEVEAQVIALRGDVEQALAGVEVELRDAGGRTVAKVNSDFEGLVYFDGVIHGRYRLVAAGADKPVDVELSAAAQFASGGVLTIRR